MLKIASLLLLNFLVPFGYSIQIAGAVGVTHPTLLPIPLDVEKVVLLVTRNKSEGAKSPAPTTPQTQGLNRIVDQVVSSVNSFINFTQQNPSTTPPPFDYYDDYDPTTSTPNSLFPFRFPFPSQSRPGLSHPNGSPVGILSQAIGTLSGLASISVSMVQGNTNLPTPRPLRGWFPTTRTTESSANGSSLLSLPSQSGSSSNPYFPNNPINSIPNILPSAPAFLDNFVQNIFNGNQNTNDNGNANPQPSCSQLQKLIFGHCRRSGDEDHDHGRDELIS